MRQATLVFLSLIFGLTSLQAGSGFELKRDQEAAWLLSGGLLSGVTWWVSNRMDPPDPQLLSPQRVPAVDRVAMGMNHAWARHASDAGLGLCTLLPLATARHPHFQDEMVMYTESLLLTVGFNTLFKRLFHRVRPRSYRIARTDERHLTPDDARSFYSGHTAVSFNGAVFAASVFQHLHPDSRWVTPLWAGGLSVAAFTGVCRVLGGAHFPTDVLAGAVAGSLTGWLIPKLHEQDDRSDFSKPVCMLRFQWRF